MHLYREKKIWNSRYKCTVLAYTNVAYTVTPSLFDIFDADLGQSCSCVPN